MFLAISHWPADLIEWWIYHGSLSLGWQSWSWCSKAACLWGSSEECQRILHSLTWLLCAWPLEVDASCNGQRKFTFFLYSMSCSPSHEYSLINVCQHFHWGKRCHVLGKKFAGWISKDFTNRKNFVSCAGVTINIIIILHCTVCVCGALFVFFLWIWRIFSWGV